MNFTLRTTAVRSIGTAVLALGVLALPASAFATSITGTSSGTFSNVSCSANCTTTSGGTVLDFGTYYGLFDFFHLFPQGTSTITIDPLSFNAATPATDVKLAELTWFNATTNDANADHNPDVTAKWNVTLHFTSPTNVTDTGAYSLAIDQTENPNIADSLAISIANSITISLPGITVGNLHLALGSGGSYNSGIWTNPENGTSTLYLEANFSNTVGTQDTQTPVPEPASMTLLGTGLLGLAGRIRKRLKK